VSESGEAIRLLSRLGWRAAASGCDVRSRWGMYKKAGKGGDLAVQGRNGAKG
jgi:hypothetical protein